MERGKAAGTASPSTPTAAAPSSCFPHAAIPSTSQAPAGRGPSLRSGLTSLSSFDLSPAAVHAASAGLGELEPVLLPALSRRAQPFTSQECLFKMMIKKNPTLT